MIEILIPKILAELALYAILWAMGGVVFALGAWLFKDRELFLEIIPAVILCTCGVILFLIPFGITGWFSVRLV